MIFIMILMTIGILSPMFMYHSVFIMVMVSTFHLITGTTTIIVCLRFIIQPVCIRFGIQDTTGFLIMAAEDMRESITVVGHQLWKEEILAEDLI